MQHLRDLLVDLADLLEVEDIQAEVVEQAINLLLVLLKEILEEMLLVQMAEEAAELEDQDLPHDLEDQVQLLR